MDPNAALAELTDLRAQLSEARANGRDNKTLRAIREDIDERRTALREWRARGGFAPRDGWPRGL
jgi:hypothetical protein